MSEIRDGLDTAEQLIYETLGLALPGALAIVGSVFEVSRDALPLIAGFASAHQWITLGVCYLAGYPVQSLSRPTVNLTLWPARLVVRIIASVSPAAAARVVAWRHAGARWLQQGHRPKLDDDVAASDRPARPPAVQLVDLERAAWSARLGLRADQHLRASDVTNLSFSALGADQRRLHRFRANTSLNRAVAALMATAMWVSLGRMAWTRHFTWAGLAIAGVSLLLFLAFMERANMYDALWNSIIGPQFLANQSAASAAPAAGVLVPTKNIEPSNSSSTALDVAPSSLNTSDAPGTAPSLVSGDLRA